MKANTGQPGDKDFSAKGGDAFSKKYGKKGYQSLIAKRWDRHFGRICLNCDQRREDIEKGKLVCEKKIKKLVLVEEVVKFKKHEFNDPAKGKPKPRTPSKNPKSK